MKKIAIVYGGDSLEHDISIVTALLTAHAAAEAKIPYILIYLGRDGVFYTGKALFKKECYQSKKGFRRGYFVSKGKTATFNSYGIRYAISSVILCVHGQGVEDGTVGAFFDTIGVPVSYGGVESAAIMQNKDLTKKIAREEGIPVVESRLVTKQKYLERKMKMKGFLQGLTGPYVIKPAHLGSSIGVSKCQKESEVIREVTKLFAFDEAVLVEEAVSSLKEYNLALLGDAREVIFSEFEEVNHEDRILTFKDKYEDFAGISPRIIPATIAPEIKEKMRKYALKAFLRLHCSGVVRFDFFYDEQENKLYLNEMNSVPGSLSYYLFESAGVSFREVIERLHQGAIYRKQHLKQRITHYEGSDLLKIGQKK